MKVDIYRKVETGESITGEFWLDAVKQCYCLEPSRHTPFYPGHPCIEAGTYRVVLTMSPHLGYVCPEVLDVPGRTAIRWHIGNSPRDVLGCCVVGAELGENLVLNSRVAFDALMAKLEGQDIIAEYHDPSPQVASPIPLQSRSEVESHVRQNSMPDQTPVPPPTPPAPQAEPPTAPAGPTINIGDEFGTAKRNLPPAKIVLIAIAALLVVVAIAYVIKRPQPQGAGSLDNVVPVDIPDQSSTMVALTFTLRNTSEKIFYVHDIHATLKTTDAESSSEAVSAVDFNRYFQAFPALKNGSLQPLVPEDKLQPGQEVKRTVIVAFPVDLQAFYKRQSVSVVIQPYDQPVPVTLTR